MLTADELRELSMPGEADILPAAKAFHRIALRCSRLQAAPHADISSGEPMSDADGNVLATSVFGWNDNNYSWWSNKNLALESPLTRACRYEGQPFWLNRKGIYTRNPNSRLARFNMDFIARTLGDLSAIVIPVHLPFAQIGVVSFTCADQKRHELEEEYESYWPILQLASSHFISEYVKLRPTQRMIPPDCALSKREVECLRWAALGKTDAEIADILQRSRATVRFHLENAMNKLDAANRTQAIFRASQLGFLGIVR